MDTMLSPEISGQGSGTLKKPDSGREPLYMLTYDHGGLVLWGPDHFAKYLRSAVSWLDRYPGFKIGLDNEAYTYDFLSQKDTALLGELKGYLLHYKGRFGIGTCTYGQPLSQFINDESNIRQIGYAIETDKTLFNYKPEVYLMSEHAMHSQIPQILNGFGFKGAIMRTHFMMYGYNPTYNSAIGWWIGRDGTRIPAIPTYRGEGNGFGWVTEDNLILTRYPGPECSEPLEAFRAKFSNINPLLATRADDSGLRQEDLVRQYEGNPDFRWVLLDDLLKLYPPPSDEYNTLPDDFHVRMPWGYCGNEIWNMSRQAEIKILVAERLAAMQTLYGGENHESMVTRSWKNLLVAQHHDIQICGILDDARKFLPASICTSDSVIQASMSYFSSLLQSNGLSQILVFNPLSWDRSELIDVTVVIPGNVNNLSIKKGNKTIPFEIASREYLTKNRSTKLTLLVLIEIPALSFQSLSVEEAKQKPESSGRMIIDKQNRLATTPYWNIKLDNIGGIADITDRQTGEKMLGKMRNAYFAGAINGQSYESTGKWNLDSIVLNDNRLILSETGTIGPIPYRLEMKLFGDSPVIYFTAKFHFSNEMIGKMTDNKRETASAFLHEEKLRFKIFPSLGIGTTGIRDLPFTIAETEDKYIEGNYWTALADGHKGLAYFNRGNMGSVHEEDGSFSLPLAYSMYYIWKTVILNGDYSYEFAVYPFKGKWDDAGLQRRALEYSYDCVTWCTTKRKNNSLSELQPFSIDAHDVIMSAFYTMQGKPYIRFYEPYGEKSEITFKCLDEETLINEVNLAGDELGKINSSVSFHPWQIRTFRLDISGQKKLRHLQN